MGAKGNLKTNFFMDLFERREIPNVYKKLSYLNEEHFLNEADEKAFNTSFNYNIYTIALIPEYLKTELKNKEKYAEKTYFQNNLGYAIRIKDILSIDGYLKTQFKSNNKVIKRSLTRLESCFNISYKTFYGTITKKDYSFLMDSLREMLILRFIQRNDQNQKLKEWDLIVNKTFDQINNREASLFVIYDNNRPIDISLNYHYHKIIFSAISSYDIDYHKFGVGHVEMIKLIEWCIKDQFEILELGYGDLEFKKRWCNYIYNFKYQVIYTRNSLLVTLLAKLELSKLSIKEYLKARKLNLLYQKVREKLSFKKLKKSNEKAHLAYEKIPITEPERFEGLVKVNLEDKKYMFLRHIIYEFLYSTREHKDNTSIFKIFETPNSYLIRGKNNAQQITLKN